MFHVIFLILGNTAFFACLAADYGLKPQTYRDFAKSQINYILGDNGDRSYVVGFGKNAANAPHHRSRWDTASIAFYSILY